MRQETYQIERTSLTINTAFIVKQFKIINNSSFTIYMNLSGAIPTIDRYEFLVAPNQTLISPPIGATQFSLLVPNYSTQGKGATLEVFEEQKEPFGNAITAITSYVNIPPFPKDVNFPNTTVLGSITITQAKDVYFILTPKTSQIEYLPYASLLVHTDSGANQIVLGAFSGLNNSFRYTPRSVPETLTLSLVPIRSGVGYDFTMSVIQSDVEMAQSIRNQRVPVSIVSGNAIEFFGKSSELGFIFALPNVNFMAAVDINLDLFLLMNTYGEGYQRQSLIFRNIAYPAVATQRVPYLVAPRFFLTGAHWIVVCVITCNSGSFQCRPIITPV